MHEGTWLRTLFEFGDKIGELSDVRAVVLFGSAARGEVTIESDIDVAVVYDEKTDDVMGKVENLAPPRVHVVHVTPKDLERNVPLAGALSGEGLLLFGKPVVLRVEELDLKSKAIVVYDTSELDVNTRNKLNHALYGRVSKVKRGKKSYVSEYEGVTAQPGIEKIGKAVLLMAREKVPTVTKTLEVHGAKWKEIPVWTY